MVFLKSKDSIEYKMIIDFGHFDRLTFDSNGVIFWEEQKESCVERKQPSLCIERCC